MACAFCLTGKMGLVRNLTAGENRRPGARPSPARLNLRDRKFNIVLMGMGRATAQTTTRPCGAACGCARRPSTAFRRLGRARITLLVGRTCCRRWSGSPRKAVDGRNPGDFTPRARPICSGGELRAHQQEIRCRRHIICRPAKRFPLNRPQPDHLRVRAARRRQRFTTGCSKARQAGGWGEVEGEPHPAETPAARDSVRGGRRIRVIDRFAKIVADHGVRGVGCARAAAVTSAPALRSADCRRPEENQPPSSSPASL